MSIESAIKEIERAMDKRIDQAASFRGIVTAVDGSRITIRRVGATTADSAYYASCSRFLLAINDEVLCVMLGKQPVVIDRIGRSAAAAPTPSVLTAAGTTAATSLNHGDDTSGLILLTPNGTGIATGTVVQLDFAVARPSTDYTVMLTRLDLIAGNPDFRFTGQTTTRFRIYSAIALTAGSQYAIGYHVRQDGN